MQDVTSDTPIVIKKSSLSAIKQFLEGAIQIRKNTTKDEIIVISKNANGENSVHTASLQDLETFIAGGCKAIVEEESSASNSEVASESTDGDDMMNMIDGIMDQIENRHAPAVEPGSMMAELSSALEDLNIDALMKSSEKSDSKKGSEAELIDISGEVSKAKKKPAAKKTTTKASGATKKEGVKDAESKKSTAKAKTTSSKAASTTKKAAPSRAKVAKKESQVVDSKLDVASSNVAESKKSAKSTKSTTAKAPAKGKTEAKKASTTKAAKPAKKASAKKVDAPKITPEQNAIIAELQSLVDSQNLGVTILRFQDDILVCKAEEGNSTRVKNKVQMLTGKAVELLSSEEVKANKNDSNGKDDSASGKSKLTDRSALIDSYFDN